MGANGLGRIRTCFVPNFRARFLNCDCNCEVTQDGCFSTKKKVFRLLNHLSFSNEKQWEITVSIRGPLCLQQSALPTELIPRFAKV